MSATAAGSNASLVELLPLKGFQSPRTELARFLASCLASGHVRPTFTTASEALAGFASPVSSGRRRGDAGLQAGNERRSLVVGKWAGKRDYHCGLRTAPRTL